MDYVYIELSICLADSFIHRAVVHNGYYQVEVDTRTGLSTVVGSHKVKRILTREKYPELYI